MPKIDLTMINFDIVSCIISAVSVLIAAIVAILTYKNLREMRKQFFEQNRGRLVFYIDNVRTGLFKVLVIKNFGNSPAKLLSLCITPDLDWRKSDPTSSSDFNISNFKDVFLAPGQHVSSAFDFENYPDKIFNIELTYETCGKTFSESYVIDLHFSHIALSYRPETKDELNALEEINDSIQQLSQRFL